jgi:glycosyltransferase involved in cell wall biosynthesis
MTSLSVVIPTRGRHRYLRQALDSVLAQTRPPLDIVVVDDGDGARDAIGHLHPAITVLDNGRRGPVLARSLGVEHAQGDTIAFLDDDDWFTDTSYLARAAEAIGNGACFCYSDGAVVFEDARPPLPFAFHANAETLERDNTILISGVVYRRDLHKELGAFDETLPFYWDWDWYLRVARAGHELTRLGSPAVAIRVHAQNMSGESLEGARRENLDRLALKHGLPRLPLKNHLDIAARAPGKPPA